MCICSGTTVSSLVYNVCCIPAGGMVASPVNRRSFRRKHLLNLLGEKEGHSQEDGVESSSDAGTWPLMKQLK